MLDLTGKDHINDLLLITDLLITDYSSSIFEAALLEVPMLFYAFDEEEYMASRDFYFAYEEMVPGPVEHTFAGMARTAARMAAGRWNPLEEEKWMEIKYEAEQKKTFRPEERRSDQQETGTGAGREQNQAALSLSQRMNQFREAFLSALDGHSTDRIAAYIKENYLENEK